MSYSKGALLPPAPSTVRGSSVKLGLDPSVCRPLAVVIARNRAR